MCSTRRTSPAIRDARIRADLCRHHRRAGPDRCADQHLPFIVRPAGREPRSAAAIDTLLDGENIHGTDDFGADESNDARRSTDPADLQDHRARQRRWQSAVARPSATPMPTSSAIACSCASTTTRSGSSLSPRPARPTAAALLQRPIPTSSCCGGVACSIQCQFTGATETISQVTLAAGTHIIEVYDFTARRLAAALHDRFGHGQLDGQLTQQGRDQDEPSSHLSFDRGHRARRVRIEAGPCVRASAAGGQDGPGAGRSARAHGARGRQR